jgi:hypothetical protein
MELPNGHFVNIQTPTNFWIWAFISESLVVPIEMNHVQKDAPWIISRFERSLTQSMIMQMIILWQHQIILVKKELKVTIIGV